MIASCSTLIRHGLRRATFPKGEGFGALSNHLSLNSIISSLGEIVKFHKDFPWQILLENAAVLEYDGGQKECK